MEPLSAFIPHLESLFTLVRYNNETSIIGCLYRPPDGDFREFILNLEQHLEFILVNFSNVNKIVIGGDCNIHLLKTSGRINDYLNMMFSYSLSTAILRPTRVTSHSATLIDHVWFKCESAKVSSVVIRSFVTDHFPVFLVFEGNLPVDSDAHLISKKRYLNDTYSKELFTTYLSREAWNEVYETEDVDQAFELFCGRLYYLFNLCFPVRVRRVRKLDQIKPYISDEIKALIKERRRLQRLYAKYPITYSVPFKRCRN